MGSVVVGVMATDAYSAGWERGATSLASFLFSFQRRPLSLSCRPRFLSRHLFISHALHVRVAWGFLVRTTLHRSPSYQISIQHGGVSELHVERQMT